MNKEKILKTINEIQEKFSTDDARFKIVSSLVYFTYLRMTKKEEITSFLKEQGWETFEAFEDATEGYMESLFPEIE